MRRDGGGLGAAAMIAALAAVSGTLALRAGPSRESLLPLLRVGQEHGGQAERMLSALIPVDADEERRIGEAMTRRLREAGAIADAGVESLGRRLERTGIPKRYAGRYAYFILPSECAAAFAVPGGRVFLTKGMLARMGSDERVSFILAHEMGHVELGHTASLVRYRSLPARWGVPGGGLLQLLRSLAALSFSETQELDADAYALRLMEAGGFRRAAAFESLARLSTLERRTAARRGPFSLLAEGLLDYGRTHPGMRERLQRLASVL
ncbi:MAG: M48 family metallopeptidase [Elusimicrobiota bacterium]